MGLFSLCCGGAGATTKDDEQAPLWAPPSQQRRRKGGSGGAAAGPGLAFGQGALRYDPFASSYDTQRKKAGGRLWGAQHLRDFRAGAASFCVYSLICGECAAADVHRRDTTRSVRAKVLTLGLAPLPPPACSSRRRAQPVCVRSAAGCALRRPLCPQPAGGSRRLGSGAWLPEGAGAAGGTGRRLTVAARRQALVWGGPQQQPLPAAGGSAAAQPGAAAAAGGPAASARLWRGRADQMALRVRERGTLTNAALSCFGPSLHQCLCTCV